MRFIVLLFALSGCNSLRDTCLAECGRTYIRAHILDATSATITADYEACCEVCEKGPQ